MNVVYLRHFRKSIYYSIRAVKTRQKFGHLFSVWKSGLRTGKRLEPNWTLTDQDCK